MQFSSAFRAAAVRRASGPTAEPVVDIALELGIATSTLYRWRRDAARAPLPPPAVQETEHVSSEGPERAHTVGQNPGEGAVSGTNQGGGRGPGETDFIAMKKLMEHLISSTRAETDSADAIPKRANPVPPEPAHRPSPHKATGEWSTADKLRILAQAASLKGPTLAAFLREQGLHKATLVQWRAAAEQALGKEAARPAPRGQRTRTQAEDRKRIRELEREIAQKDRALAKVATFELLRKNHRGLWGEGE